MDRYDTAMMLPVSRMTRVLGIVIGFFSLAAWSMTSMKRFRTFWLAVGKLLMDMIKTAIRGIKMPPLGKLYVIGAYALAALAVVATVKIGIDSYRADMKAAATAIAKSDAIKAQDAANRQHAAEAESRLSAAAKKDRELRQQTTGAPEEVIDAALRKQGVMSLLAHSHADDVDIHTPQNPDNSGVKSAALTPPDEAIKSCVVGGVKSVTAACAKSGADFTPATNGQVLKDTGKNRKVAPIKSGVKSPIKSGVKSTHKMLPKAAAVKWGENACGFWGIRHDLTGEFTADLPPATEARICEVYSPGLIVQRSLGM